VPELREALGSYPNAQDLRWVQEEPANQGAWPFMALNLAGHLEGRTMHRVSRPPSSAPAAGSHVVHEHEQQLLLEQAFAS
jgi:2-oxoglutarate dehydrogenase complex dehydrogenase (E1) component-like enzyme